MLIRLRMVFLVLFLICNSSAVYSQDSIKADDVKKEAEEISNNAKKIINIVDSITNGITKLDKLAEEVKNKVVAIKTDANEIKTQAVSEKENVEKIKEDANATDANLDDLKKKADKSKKTIDDLMKKVNDANDKVEKLTAYFHETITDVKYKTKWILVNMGMIALNPYSIKKKEGTDKYFLSESGTTDSHFFTEVYFKHRASWIDRDCSNKRSCFDGDFRIGSTSTSKDSSGAVVSGSGDAYMELSIGWIPMQDFPDPNQGQSINNTPIISYNFLEFFGGLVTDKGSQSIHYYGGIGPAIVVGAPFTNDRKVEAITGLYYGFTQSPNFVNSQSNEVELQNNYPKYKDFKTMIWRADVHMPIGESGFLTVNGRFNYIVDRNETGYINPWTVSIGYTIPPEEIFESIDKIIKH